MDKLKKILIDSIRDEIDRIQEVIDFDIKFSGGSESYVNQITRLQMYIAGLKDAIKIIEIEIDNELKRQKMSSTLDDMI